MKKAKLTAIFLFAAIFGIVVSDLSSVELSYLEIFLLTLTLAILSIAYLRRENINAFIVGKFENLSSQIDLFSDRPVEYIKGYLEGRSVVISSVIAITAAHFWLQWNYTFRYIHMGGGLAVVKTLNVFIEYGFIGILDEAFQINNYTGNPIFLLPVIELFGYSPNAVRISLIGSFAVSTAIFFLSYREIFDFRKAWLGTLFLFTMSEYIYFRWFDYTYVVLLISVLFYVYARWRNSERKVASAYFYLIAFLGGLFFYFKTTILYLLAGFAVAVIAIKKQDVFRWEIIPLLLVFLAGATPFIVYNAANMNYIESSAAESNDVSIAGPENLTLADSLVARYDQLGRWVRTDLYNLDNNISTADTPENLYGYNFETDETPGGEIHNPINLTAAVFGGEGYDAHFFSGFHPVSIGLLLIIPILIYRKRHVDLAAIFLTFFVLMIFLPSTSGFRVGHMNIFAPFVTLLYIAALDLIPERFENTSVYRYGYMILAGLMVVSALLTVTVLEPNNATSRSIGPVDEWGGDQQFYSDFKQLDTAPRLYTNSYRIKVIASYFRGKNARYVIPEGMTGKQLRELPDTGGHIIGITSRVQEPFEISEATLLLRQQLPCEPRKEFCGASKKSIMNETGIRKEELEKVEIAGIDYLKAESKEWRHWKLNSIN